ncbi:MAG TPA: ribosome maturation factor RimM [Candidatus Baltobacteraceae bacterium]
MPVGRIAGIFGLNGELKCDPTSAGRTLFFKDAELRLIDAGGAARTVRLETVREHKGRLLVRLAGIADATAAEAFAGATFYADATQIDLDENEYLDRDLVGCTLYDDSGASLGVVTAVQHFPTSDMLVVGGKLVPMIHQFIRSIDIAKRSVVVDLPLGLLDETQAEEG